MLFLCFFLVPHKTVTNCVTTLIYKNSLYYIWRYCMLLQEKLWIKSNVAKMCHIPLFVRSRICVKDWASVSFAQLVLCRYCNYVVELQSLWGRNSSDAKKIFHSITFTFTEATLVDLSQASGFQFVSEHHGQAYADNLVLVTLYVSACMVMMKF